MSLKKNLFSTTGFMVLLFALTLCLAIPKAQALSGSAYSAGRIIDDGVFFRVNTMSITDIQDFLNSKVPVCDTNGDQIRSGGQTRRDYSAANGVSTPFICLKDFRQDTPAENSEPGLCNGLTAGNKSAAQIIYEVAQSCSVNPKALIVLLQKEESLITDDWPWPVQYRSATGFGCPDTAACDANYYGFFNQVYSAARQFKYYALHPDSFNYQARRSSFVLWSPASGCGGSNIFLENQATAGLYNYTPYQPNQAALNNLYGTGDSCSAYGNRNFWRMYNDWFGGTWTNEEGYLFITSSATALHYNPGGTGTVSVTVKNIGFSSWYSDNNLPAGKQPTRLATAGYQDSPFITADASSLWTHNQILMTPDVVAPGENATFTFNVNGPYKTLTFHNHFIPIVGGQFLRDLGIDIPLHADTPDWQLTTSTIDTQTPLPNQLSLAHFSILNTSGSTWFSDNNLPAGKQPTRLVTAGYQDSPFADTSDPRWLGTRNQIKMSPDAVAPGQTATFDAYFVGPISNKAVTSAFRFMPVIGGVFTQDKGAVFNMSTAAANMGYQFISSGGLPASMSPGAIANLTVTIQNTGNVVWQSESVDNGSRSLRLMMNHPNYRNSSFYNSGDSNWLAANQIAKPAGATLPGQSTTFSFSWKAPLQTGNYADPFAPIIAGNFMNDIGTVFHTTVQ